MPLKNKNELEPTYWLRKLPCYTCNCNFSTIKELEDHLINNHSSKTQILNHQKDVRSCTAFKNKGELEVIDIVEEEPIVILPQTSKRPVLPENCTKNSKEQFVNQAISQDKSTLSKKIIIKKSSSKSQASNHENLLRHSSTPSEFTCYICHTIFLQEIGLMRHIERVHKSKSINEDCLNQSAKIYRVDPDVSVYSSEVRIIHGLETPSKCASNEVVLGI